MLTDFLIPELKSFCTTEVFLLAHTGALQVRLLLLLLLLNQSWDCDHYSRLPWIL